MNVVLIRLQPITYVNAIKTRSNLSSYPNTLEKRLILKFLILEISRADGVVVPIDDSVPPGDQDKF